MWINEEWYSFFRSASWIKSRLWFRWKSASFIINFTFCERVSSNWLSLYHQIQGGKIMRKRKREETSQLVEGVNESTSKRMSSQNERKTTFNQGHLFDKEQCLESIHTHTTHTVPVWMSIPFRLSLPTIFYINEAAAAAATTTSSTCTLDSLTLCVSVCVCMCMREYNIKSMTCYAHSSIFIRI